MQSHIYSSPQMDATHFNNPLVGFNDVSSTEITEINQGNHQLIVDGACYSPYSPIMEGTFLQQQQYDPYTIDQHYTMLTPPVEVDQYEYDLKPIIYSPEYPVSEISYYNNHFAHPSPSKSLNNDNNNMYNQGFEENDIKLTTIPELSHITDTTQDVKLPLSPPSTPPTPHSSSTTTNNNTTEVITIDTANNDTTDSDTTAATQDTPKKITSINVASEVNDDAIVKQEIEEEEDNGQENEIEKNELPTYVNPKQYNRILKRRIARERFQRKYNISKERKPYIHESRHNHAVRRLRGPGGRFLSVNATQQETTVPEITEIVTEMNRRQSLNSTSSSCVSPTTPVSASPFFNVSNIPAEYTYINSNEFQGNMTTNFIENNDSYSAWEAPEMCKNNYYPNMSTGIIESPYIPNSSNMFDNSQLAVQTEEMFYISPITPITPSFY